jgi:Flp pilus assembly protein TadD
VRQELVKEADRLAIKSEIMLKQMALLGEPVVQLTEQEKGLFKQPVVEIDDDAISISAIKTGPRKGDANGPMKSESGKPTGEAPKKDEDSGAVAKKVPQAASGRGKAAPMTDEARTLASQANERFEKGDFTGAEELYRKVIAANPENAFALTNLGVTQFRLGRLGDAEVSLRKALELSPDDACARSTLGIVYYSQDKLDQAVEELSQSLVINQNSPVAHNYLGIVASRKGWQDAARKELETATTLDPNYADAFFNLAVVCATQKPADKDAARKAYRRATELGAQRDPRMEELVK